MWGSPGHADWGCMAPSGRIRRIRSCWVREDGQTMAEYAVVLAVITIVTVLAYMQLGDAIALMINAVRNTLA
jgi:Flp pilus assembly pilin Flp